MLGKEFLFSVHLQLPKPLVRPQCPRRLLAPLDLGKDLHHPACRLPLPAPQPQQLPLQMAAPVSTNGMKSAISLAHGDAGSAAQWPILASSSAHPYRDAQGLLDSSSILDLATGSSGTDRTPRQLSKSLAMPASTATRLPQQKQAALTKLAALHPPLADPRASAVWNEASIHIRDGAREFYLRLGSSSTINGHRQIWLTVPFCPFFRVWPGPSLVHAYRHARGLTQVQRLRHH